MTKAKMAGAERARMVFAAVLACGAAVAVSLAIADPGTRLGVGLALIPLAVLAGLAVRFVAPSLKVRAAGYFAWLRARGTSLEQASHGRAPELFVGRLRCREIVEAPSGASCALYLARVPSAGGFVSSHDSGALELETERDGVLPLQDGKWKTADPFDDTVVDGEVRLDDGALVVVRARIKSEVHPGAGYRDTETSYTLRVKGGAIFPVAGFSHRALRSRARWIGKPVLAVAIVLGVFALATARRQPPVEAPLTVATAAPSAEPAAPGETPCGPMWTCPKGLVCDRERDRCVETIEGKLEEGALCKGRGECGEGLRCQPDRFESDEGKTMRRCMVSCRIDAHCAPGRWCVPCMRTPLEHDGDCTDPARLRGPIAIVCDMLHKRDPGLRKEPAGRDLEPR